MRSKILLILSIFGVLPLMVLQLISIARKPYLWFVPVAWLVVAALIYSLSKKGFAANPIRRITGQTTLIIGSIVAMAAGSLVSPSLAHVACHAFLLGWLLLLAGFTSWTRIVAVSSIAWSCWPLTEDVALWFSKGIQRYARSISSNILDFFEVKHYLSGDIFELPSMRMDLTGAELALDGPLLLTCFALCVLVYCRATLLPSVLLLLVVPLISLLGSSCLILIQIWAAESLAENWTFGTTGNLWLRSGVFATELVACYLALIGVRAFLEPIPADSEEEARRGAAAFYNRFVLWPLNYAPQSDEPSYYEDDESIDAGKVKTTRPDYILTKQATDPWQGTKAFAFCGFVLTLATVFGVLCLFVPARERSLTATASDEQIDALASKDFAFAIEDLTFVNALVTEQDERDVLSWYYSRVTDPVELQVLMPADGFERLWESQATWLGIEPPRRIEVKSQDGSVWPLIQTEFRKPDSSLVYSWYSAIRLEDKKPFVPEQTVSALLQQRFSQTLFGRLLGNNDRPQTAMLVLQLDSNEVITRRSQRELAEHAVTLFRAFSEEFDASSRQANN